MADIASVVRLHEVVKTQTTPNHELQRERLVVINALFIIILFFSALINYVRAFNNAIQANEEQRLRDIAWRNQQIEKAEHPDTQQNSQEASLEVPRQKLKLLLIGLRN